MELSGRRYPIGIQNFEQLRTRNCVYVDKTELVYKLVNTDQIYFFSRPRRFGKSLLVSTLEAYFQGKKELFEGLAMERLEQEWEVCPVLHVDFSLTKYTELRDLTGQLNLFLSRWEEIYGKKEEEEGAAERLQGIILRAYAKTGKPVVVLIDEYDAP
ncbi:AAA family ATPase, partial [Bacteroides uniformis]